MRQHKTFCESCGSFKSVEDAMHSQGKHVSDKRLRYLGFLSGALLFTLFAARASATAQFPDTLFIEGKALDLFSQPLAALESSEPKTWRALQRWRPAHDCSAAWFGFTAQWRIEDDRLLLIAIASDPCSDAPRSVPLKRVFGRKRGASPVFAEWFTGVLRVPQGRLVEYIHAGFASRYERNLMLQIERGQVLRQWEEPGAAQP
jgi:hypothetical protein